MRLLYAAFVLSMAALVWTVISIRRHIRKHDSLPVDPLLRKGSPNEDPLKNID
jgi:hypothetical protein